MYICICLFTAVQIASSVQTTAHPAITQLHQCGGNCAATAKTDLLAVSVGIRPWPHLHADSKVTCIDFRFERLTIPHQTQGHSLRWIRVGFARAPLRLSTKDKTQAGTSDTGRGGGGLWGACHAHPSPSRHVVHREQTPLSPPRWGPRPRKGAKAIGECRLVLVAACKGTVFTWAWD